MPFDWDGTRILQVNSALPDKRRVYNNHDVLVPTDLREWLTPGNREEIRRALRTMAIPIERDPGTFDTRARVVWRWVVDNIEYREDPAEQRLVDYWQFPAETIAIGQGDCEDCAFLLASLLLGSGISCYCVRVVIGTLSLDGSTTEPHAWPIYKDESGRWCILESTLAKGTPLDALPSAESLANSRSDPPTYTPIMCLNTEHVWEVGRRCGIEDVEAFIAYYSNKKRQREMNGPRITPK